MSILKSTLSPIFTSMLTPMFPVSGDLTAFVGGFAGDSMAEYFFNQYGGAGEATFEAQAADYFSSPDLYDIANSGTYLLESTALNANAGNTNIFWVDDSGALSAGAQFTNNIVDNNTHNDKVPDMYACNLGINDNLQITATGTTALDIENAFDFIADQSVALKSIPFFMLNTLGRDAGGDNAGCNIIREGIYNAIDNNVNIKRGVDIYDLPRVDNKHLTQAGVETHATRMAIQSANYLGQTTDQALGASVTSAELNVDEITLNLSHVGGTDITAPSAGNGGMDATDDGVAMGATTLSRIDATTAKLIFPQDKAPSTGSAVKVYVPYGRDGGLAATPDVMKDNSALSLPIQSNIITATNVDPIQGLDNLVSYFDARGSVKTTSGSAVTDIAAISGIDFTRKAAGSEPTYSNGFLEAPDASTQIGYTADFTQGTVQTFGFVFKFPATISTSTLMAIGNSSQGSTNVSLKTSGGNLTYGRNEANAFETLQTGIASQTATVFLEYVSDSVCNVYYNSDTVTHTFDPIDTYFNSNFRRVWLFSVNNTDALTDLGIGAFFHTTDNLTSGEKTNIRNNWVSRFNL